MSTKPSVLDVPAALASGDEQALWDVHRAAGERLMWERVTALARENDRADQLMVAEGVLADLPEVTAFQDLAATQRLADLLTSRRWLGMQRSREEGASWAEIGGVLHISEQAARDCYRKKIALQERYVGDLHDTARARAALADDSEEN